jgi:MFS transporter, ACS family, aldohexuronate transporter
MTTSRRAWWITLAATAAMTLSYLDRQALSALAPTITADLKLTNTQYGFLGSAFSVAYLLAGPLAARWCDRLGARRALLLGVLAWSVAAACHSLAVGFYSFLALRLLLGAVEAPSLPAGAQTVQAVLAPVDRARGMALLFAGMSVGSALAPPIAIGIGSWLGWRAAFIALALIAMLWIPLWQLVTARGRLPHVPPAQRASWRVVLRDRNMVRGLVGLAAIIPVSTFTLQWGAKFFAAHHVGKAAYATYLLASGIAYDVGAVAFGDLASRRAKRRGNDGSPARLLLGISTACAAAGTIGMALLAGEPAIVAALIVTSIGRGSFVALVNADTLARLPNDWIATGAALIASAQSLIILAFNPLVGASVDAYATYTPALLGIAAFTVAPYVIWAAWKPSPAAP